MLLKTNAGGWTQETFLVDSGTEITTFPAALARSLGLPLPLKASPGAVHAQTGLEIRSGFLRFQVVGMDATEYALACFFLGDPNTPPPPGSPLFLNALDFYRTHAVGPDFVWSWRDASLQQGVFRETIRRSDTAYRRAQNQLGFLLANHVVSAIDALISSRLAAAARRPAALQTTLGPVTVVRMSLEF